MLIEMVAGPIPMDRHVDRARAAMELRRWDLAQESLGLALADDPGDAVLHVLQAEVHYRQGDYVAATESAREAVSLAPQWSFGYYWLTYCLLANFMASADRERLAADAADTAIECDPDDPDNYCARADVARVAEKHQQALEFASEGLRLDPEHIPSLRLVAQAEIALKDYEAAETTLRRLLLIEPESVFAHRQLAAVLLAFGRRAEAYEHAKTIIRSDPDDADVRTVYGEVVRRQHPIARWLLVSGDVWKIYMVQAIALGFAPLLLLRYAGFYGAFEAALSVVAVLWLILCCSYALAARALADGIIAYSNRYSELLPETRGLRSVLPIGILAGLVATGAVIWGVVMQSSQPILLGGNIVVAGAIVFIATLARTRREMFWESVPLLLPISVQTIAMFWEPSPQRAGGAAMLVLAAWALAVAAPLMISNRERS